jgi:hypothetical protein
VVIVGLKSSFSQPSSSGIDALLESKIPGSSHESTLNVALRGVPHDVGFVNNGTSGVPAGHSPTDSGPPSKLPAGVSRSSSPSPKPPLDPSKGDATTFFSHVPRTALWTGLAGTPQIDTLLPYITTAWLTSDPLVVRP